MTSETAFQPPTAPIDHTSSLSSSPSSASTLPIPPPSLAPSSLLPLHEPVPQRAITIEIEANDDTESPSSSSPSSSASSSILSASSSHSEVVRRAPTPKGQSALVANEPRPIRPARQVRKGRPESRLSPEWLVCLFFLILALCCLVFAFFWIWLQLGPTPTEDEEELINVREMPPKQPDGRFAWEGPPRELVHRSFVRQASYAVERRDDITLITHVTVDRFPKLLDMVLVWEGPISVVLYAPANSDELAKALAIYDSSPPLLYYVDLHVVYANNTRYPANVLRNLAINEARSDYVFSLDVDLITSGQMHSHLKQFLKSDSHLAAAFTQPRAYRVALVVPAFESDLSWQSLPRTKDQLATSLKDQLTRPVNLDRCAKCHGPTNYDYWIRAKSPYRAHFHWIYEPYLLLRKTESLPLFEERLKGYGFDKNFHTWHLALAGYSFWVLPDVFVVHVNHPVASWDGPSHNQQQWDSLAIVCDKFQSLREQYGHPPKQAVFDEPDADHCFSNEHW